MLSGQSQFTEQVWGEPGPYSRKSVGFALSIRLGVKDWLTYAGRSLNLSLTFLSSPRLLGMW